MRVCEDCFEKHNPYVLVCYLFLRTLLLLTPTLFFSDGRSGREEVDSAGKSSAPASADAAAKAEKSRKEEELKLQEQEELELALALSRSEAEVKSSNNTGKAHSARPYSSPIKVLTDCICYLFE